MGGPSGEAELPLFLRNIFLDRDLMRLPLQSISGRLLARARLGRSRANYESAGWSPLKGLTDSLAGKLTARLASEGISVRALYTHLPPYIEEAPRDALIVPLYPQFSSALAGAIAKRLPGRKVAGPWYDREDFIALLADGVGKALAGAAPERTALMLIAHGLPESFAAGGDPYLDQVRATCGALAARFPGHAASISYIGRSGPLKWSAPEAGEVIDAMKGVDRIAAAYVSFPLDNIEVLHDIDRVLREKAAARGIREFVRAPLPNDSDAFAGVLEAVIRGNM